MDELSPAAQAILRDIRSTLSADYLDRVFGPDMKQRIDRALSATPPAPVEQDVERAADESLVREALAFFAGVPIGEYPGESYAEKFATANRYIATLSTLTPARAEGFKAALDAIRNVRAKNAGDFERNGAAWEAYDRAVLDCHAAVAALGSNGHG